MNKISDDLIDHISNKLNTFGREYILSHWINNLINNRINIKYLQLHKNLLSTNGVWCAYGAETHQCHNSGVRDD